MELRKHKIAVLCNYRLLPERVGGMDYFFWDFDKKCKENDIEVHWFFPNISHHGNYGDLKIVEPEDKSIETFFVGYLQKEQQEYSHIITHFVELCTPFFKEVKQLSDAKIIAIDHNPRPLNGYPLKKQLQKKLKGILYSRYIDVFVGVSDYTSREIIKDFGKHLKNKTITIYNGVIIDTILERKDRKTEKPSFLVASHLRESKGIQDLIDAVDFLEKNIKDEIRIDIYGYGPYQEKLSAKIKDKNLNEIFTFKGSRSDLNEIFCQYDYMLQPTHMECFSLSILESLAANVPVITTNVGGNEEAVKHNQNGFIFQAKNSQQLKNILENLFYGKTSIDINTRELIENNFSLKKMVDNHFNLLSK